MMTDKRYRVIYDLIEKPGHRVIPDFPSKDAAYDWILENNKKILSWRIEKYEYVAPKHFTSEIVMTSKNATSDDVGPWHVIHNPSRKIVSSNFKTFTEALEFRNRKSPNKPGTNANDFGVFTDEAARETYPELFAPQTYSYNDIWVIHDLTKGVLIGWWSTKEDAVVYFDQQTNQHSEEFTKYWWIRQYIDCKNIPFGKNVTVYPTGETEPPSTTVFDKFSLIHELEELIQKFKDNGISLRVSLELDFSTND